MAEVLFKEWRDEQAPNNYPFADNATLSNGQVVLPPEFLTDAVLYPVGGQARMYLSKLEIGSEVMTIFVGDPSNPELAFGEVNLLDIKNEVLLEDRHGRPAGMFLTNPLRISITRTFGLGIHEFQLDQTEFVVDVCVPTPEIGVRAIELDDGNLFFGEVWIYGGDGVVLRHRENTGSQFPVNVNADLEQVIQVNVVGDPLFRRRLCAATELFDAPQFIKKVIFIYDGREFETDPGDFGDIRISVNNTAVEDTILRVRTSAEGVLFEVVGESLNGSRG